MDGSNPEIDKWIEQLKYLCQKTAEIMRGHNPDVESRIEDKKPQFGNYLGDKQNKALKKAGYCAETPDDSFFKLTQKIIETAKDNDGNSLLDIFKEKTYDAKFTGMNIYSSTKDDVSNEVNVNDIHVKCLFEDKSGPLEIIVYPLQKKVEFDKGVYIADIKV